ncbi:MAG TPA: VWA domain-containing protein [Vicinamibacterales bacterium]|nr:VWA domain-containing protein [Vicinamibacterales bacterium]
MRGYAGRPAAQGRFVRDLTQDDFTISEDGKPQALGTFSLVDIPVRRTTSASPAGTQAREAVEPDVATNERPFDGRLYVMVLDDLHVVPSRTAYVTRAARRFIDEHLGPDDLMAVVHVRARAEYSQELTSNKRLLRAAVEQFIGHADPSKTVAMYEQYMVNRGQGSVPTDPYADSRMNDSLTTLRQLEVIAESLGSSVRGRKKSILFISEGFSVGFTGGQGGLSERARDVVRAASRSNVNIYAIDPRGLTDLGDDNIRLNGLKAGDNPEQSALRAITPTGLRDQQRGQGDSLRAIADETGGFAVVNTSDFAGAFDRVVEENSSYYVLSYSPPNPKRDGKFHDVKVRVTRPGLTVQARPGYTAPKSTPRAAEQKFAETLSPDARRALDNPLPITGLAIQVFAAPFRGTATHASVLVGAEMRGKDLRLTPGSQLQLSYFAADTKGDVRGAKSDAFELNVTADTKAAIEAAGVRAMTRLDLPPGRYQLRVIADRLDAGGVGSVSYDLDVPDFSKAPLAMSGLVLTSAAASRQPNLSIDKSLSSTLVPVAVRVFPTSDALTVFAEIYDNQVSQSHRVDITLAVTSEAGIVVFRSQETRESSELSGQTGFYGFLADVALANVTAGSYVLKVEARSSLGDRAVVSRQIPFTTR